METGPPPPLLFATQAQLDSLSTMSAVRGSIRCSLPGPYTHRHLADQCAVPGLVGGPYTRARLERAAAGLSRSRGGLNVPEILHVLHVAELAEDGDSSELRGRLRDHLKWCISVFTDAGVFE